MFSFFPHQLMRKEMSASRNLSIMNMFNLADDGKWTVIGESNELSLVHYVANGDETPLYGELRGIVVDTKRGYPVAKSFPYTPSQEFQGNIEELPGNVKLYLGVEGTILRVFKHNGTVFISTHKKLNATKSRWGSSQTFVELFKKYGGTIDLFDETCLYGQYCYVFMVVDPSIMISSKLPIGKSFNHEGFVMYLGARKMFDVTDNEAFYEGKKIFTKEELGAIDTKERDIKTTDLMEYLDSPSSFVGYVEPKELTKEQSLDHLKYGMFSKYRDSPVNGEFIIVSNGDIRNSRFMVKICSSDYLTKVAIRYGDPNIYHRYYTLSDRISGINLPIPSKEYIDQEFPPETREYILGNSGNQVYFELMNSIPRDCVRKEYKLLEKFAYDIDFAVSTLIDKHIRGKDVPYYVSSSYRKDKGTENYKIIRNALLKNSYANIYSIIRDLREEARLSTV